MENVKWDRKSYIIDGKPSFLVSGEFHYFRVPKNDWKRRLELFKEAGGNFVATYIPWVLHEPVEGDIRFGDVPERDLEEFLKICGEVGLYIVCRPGPYQYSELVYDGLPGWLCNNYPEILARDVNGNIFRQSSISYLHPVLLDKARKWYDTVCPILSKYTVSRGGAVALVQVDNELMGIHDWFGGWDYNVETMGFGKVEGRYPKFLEKKYKCINEINRSYGTFYKSFLEVLPFNGTSANTLEEKRRVKDYQDFYFETSAEYISTLAGWVKSYGIDCSIVHNSANPNMNSYFLETIKSMGEGFLLGSDHYYNLEHNQHNPTPNYASNVFYSNEMMRLMGYPPTVFELPGGSNLDWPPITPEDLKACYMTNVAFGMKGFNYYIYTGGPNPEKMGADGDNYDYNAAISANGEIRPIYYVQKEFEEFLNKNSWLSEAEGINDFYLGLNWEYTRSKYYFAGRSPIGYTNIEAWEFLRKGVMTSAFCASLSPGFVNLYSNDLISKVDKPLFVASSVSMSAGIQDRLIHFVENGGKLIIGPVIPEMDEDFNKCTILKDFLASKEIIKNRAAYSRINMGSLKNILANESIYLSESLPPGADVIAYEENSGAVAGWRKGFDRGGIVLWLGISWRHTKFIHSEIVKFLLSESGCKEFVICCDNPNIWTMLRSDENNKMLFVMNLLSSPMKANISVKTDLCNYKGIGELSLNPMEVRVLNI